MDKLKELISPVNCDDPTHCIKISHFHQALCNDTLPALPEIEEAVEEYNYKVLMEMAFDNSGGADVGIEDLRFTADLLYEQYYEEYFDGMELYIVDILEDLNLATWTACDVGYELIGDAQTYLNLDMLAHNKPSGQLLLEG